MLVRYSPAPPETASPMLIMDAATMLRGSERHYYSQFGLTADEGEWVANDPAYKPTRRPS